MATRAEESVAHVRRPLEGIYGVSLLTAILALVPYILVVSGAMHPGAAGLRYSIWLTLGVAAALTLGGVALYLLGGAGLPRPDLVAWIEHNRPAIGSPPLAQKLRES